MNDSILKLERTLKSSLYKVILDIQSDNINIIEISDNFVRLSSNGVYIKLVKEEQNKSYGIVELSNLSNIYINSSRIITDYKLNKVCKELFDLCLEKNNKIERKNSVIDEINKLSIDIYGYSLNDIYNLEKSKKVIFIKKIIMAIARYHYNKDTNFISEIFSISKSSVSLSNKVYLNELKNNNHSLIELLNRLPKEILKSVTKDENYNRKITILKTGVKTPITESDISKFDDILKVMYNGDGFKFFKSNLCTHKDILRRYFGVIYYHLEYGKNILSIEEVLGINKYQTNRMINRLRQRIKNHNDIAFKILNDLDLKYYNVIYDFLTKKR